MMMQIFKAARYLIAPLLIGTLVILGGSSQAGLIREIWLPLASAIVFLLSVPIAVRREWPLAIYFLMLAIVGFIAFSALQLYPLPIEWIRSLGGRDVVFEGFSLVGLTGVTSLPLSLSPDRTVTSITGFMPAIAAFTLVLAIGWRQGASAMFWAIPVLAAVSFALGLAQAFMPGGERLYFYEITNRGWPVGIFANVNHQATLQLMAIPVVAALLGNLRSRWSGTDLDVGKACLLAAFFLSHVTGVLITGSGAGVGMLVPLLLLSGLIAFRSSGQEAKQKRGQAITIMAAVIVAFAATMINPDLGAVFGSLESDGATSRSNIWPVAMAAAEDHYVFGSGLGTFEPVYKLYEDRATISPVYVNHAHNDYLQTLIETGLIGSACLALGLAVWIYLFAKVWLKAPDGTQRQRRAAAVAILVVVMHSLVDYPARTPTIAVLLGVCFAVLLISQRTRAAKRAETETENEKRLTL